LKYFAWAYMPIAMENELKQSMFHLLYEHVHADTLSGSLQHKES